MSSSVVALVTPGRSATGSTVSTNVSPIDCVVLLTLAVTVTVIIDAPKRFAAGDMVSVRVDPEPLNTTLALGNKIWLLDTAVTVIAGRLTPVSPILNVSTAGTSSSVVV